MPSSFAFPIRPPQCLSVWDSSALRARAVEPVKTVGYLSVDPGAKAVAGYAPSLHSPAVTPL